MMERVAHRSKRSALSAACSRSERLRPKADTAICHSVQKGLTSRAYQAGRLSVRREGGEHLFHRLLAADLRRALSVR